MKKIIIIFILLLISNIQVIAKEDTSIGTIDMSEIDSSYGTENSSINIRNWNNKKGAQYFKGDIVFYDGQKFLVLKDFISSGKKNQIYDSKLFKVIVESGIENSEGPFLRMETCAGYNPTKTVATNQVKKNIVNKGLSDVWRKTNFYSLSTSKQHSQSVKLSGYGVTVSYSSGSTTSGGWGTTNVNGRKFSKMRSNVKGNIQKKTLNNCSTVTKFIKTHEWITVFYEN